MTRTLDEFERVIARRIRVLKNLTVAGSINVKNLTVTDTANLDTLLDRFTKRNRQNYVNENK